MKRTDLLLIIILIISLLSLWFSYKASRSTEKYSNPQCPTGMTYCEFNLACCPTGDKICCPSPCNPSDCPPTLPDCCGY